MSPRGRARRGSAIVAAVAGAAACLAAGTAAPPGTAGSERPPARLVVDGRSTLALWVAASPEERSRGVTAHPLRRGVGMWFLWRADTDAAFWMRGVSSPLLLAWIGADGRVLGLRRLAPCPTGRDCPLYRAPRAFRSAIEFLPADLRRSGLRVGVRAGLRRSG